MAANSATYANQVSHTLLASTKNEQFCDIQPTHLIRKIEQQIYCLKTIESAITSRISRPIPHPPSVQTLCMYGSLFVVPTLAQFLFCFKFRLGQLDIYYFMCYVYLTFVFFFYFFHSDTVNVYLVTVNFLLLCVCFDRQKNNRNTCLFNKYQTPPFNFTEQLLSKFDRNTPVVEFYLSKVASPKSLNSSKQLLLTISKTKLILKHFSQARQICFGMASKI